MHKCGNVDLSRLIGTENEADMGRPERERKRKRALLVYSKHPQTQSLVHFEGKLMNIVK